MAGLLGDSWDDPRTMAALQMAQGLLSSPRLMQGATNGAQGYLQAMQQAKQQQMLERMKNLQMQQAQLQLSQQQRAADKQQALDGLAQRFVQSPAQQALAAGGAGPTVQAAEAMKSMPGGFDFKGYADSLAALDPQAALQMQGMLRKESPQPIKVGAGESLWDPTTRKPLYTNPKEQDLPSAIREYQYARQQGYPGSFQQFQLEQRRAGASSVSVNTGQHGFDNTLKLRTDFRSEPIYKAQQEMQSAHSQITEALKKGDAIGDLAGATKIMKLLDPGSVVRESELGMAMAATGLRDRIGNLANMIMTGQKLTPQQRKEFQGLADTLMAQSNMLYNAKRQEYGGIAKRNGLNEIDVMGAQPGQLPALPKMPGLNEDDPLGLLR